MVTLLKLDFIEEKECGGNVSNGNCKENIEPFSFSDIPYCINIIRTLQGVQSLSISFLFFPVLINVNI